VQLSTVFSEGYLESLEYCYLLHLRLSLVIFQLFSAMQTKKNDNIIGYLLPVTETCKLNEYAFF
jgi:hypothetical protein